jgi:hypothetical protein
VSGCSAPHSLPPHTPFRPRLASAPCSLPPHAPVRPRLPSAPYSLPPQPPFRPRLPSTPASLPPPPPFRPSLPCAPASLPPIGVRECLSAEVECDGTALASCSVSMCECAARMRGGSQAHPLPSCAPVVARLAVHARSHSMEPNERSRARTMANTPLTRRLRDESGSPCPHTVIKHAFGRQKSPAWRFRSGSRLGRRTPRSGMLLGHDLHRMGREACWRHDIAYLPVMSWGRVTPV